MSTVHEVITAKHCGMKVLAFSLVTNMVVTDYDDQKEVNHEEVITTGELRERLLQEFVTKVVSQIEETQAEDVGK